MSLPSKAGLETVSRAFLHTFFAEKKSIRQVIEKERTYPFFNLRRAASSSSVLIKDSPTKNASTPA